jgi:hypothetical protein
VIVGVSVVTRDGSKADKLFVILQTLHALNNATIRLANLNVLAFNSLDEIDHVGVTSHTV